MLRFVLAGCLSGVLAGCGSTEQSGQTDVVAQANQPPSAVSDAATVTTSDGVTIHYDDQGKGAPTILFVHGWSCDRSYWKAQRDHFAERYRVVTVDLAGHGESGQNRDDWTMSAFGADVAAVAQALDLNNIVLVGHSMGGPVVMEAANQLPDRVAAVVGVDTLRSVGRPRTPAEMQVRMAAMDKDFMGLARPLVSGMFLETSDPQLKDYVVSDMLSAPLAVAKGAMLGLASYDAAPRLAALSQPFVLINSDYRPTDQGAISAMAQLFTYIQMSGVGHFLMMEDPDTFNTHLSRVIEALLIEY